MEDNFDISALKSTKKKRKNSKVKGNAFELKICKLFNEHFNTKDFNRSPNSGAYATTHKLPSHLIVHGDIITPKGFKFVIECKKGYNKESIDSLLKPNSNIRIFIDKAKKESEKINKSWLVLIQQDRKNIIAIGPRDFSYLNDTIYFNDIAITTLENLLQRKPRSFWFEC